MKSAASASPRSRVLLLHGLLSRGGSKGAFFRSLGFEVSVPVLPTPSFRESVRIARDEIFKFKPHVIVGSSRGGAVALHLDDPEIPLVLLAPAYRLFGGLPTRAFVPPGSVVIHSAHDRIVPIGHSRSLCQSFPELRLIIAGADHRLNCQEARRSLTTVLEALRPPRKPVSS